MITLKTLDKAFDDYNKLYFENKIPKCKIYWSKKLLKQGWMGESDLDRRTILICKELKIFPVCSKMTLLHEMMHLYLWTKRDKDYFKCNTPKFDRLMFDKLAKKGAFINLW